MAECRIRRAPLGLRPTECIRDDGHEGDHEDFAGNRWSADETPTCRVEHPRSPNPMPNTRIVRCGKPAGHPGRLHAEALEDGEFGPEWAADETPAQPTTGSGWVGRNCDGCGQRVAARSATMRVLCHTCHPGDLPMSEAEAADWPASRTPDVAPAPDGNAGGAEPDLGAIRARADAAPPGPWFTGDRYPGYVAGGHGFPWQVVFSDESIVDLDDACIAEFVAHARTDVPALVAALAGAIRERDRWHRTHDGVLHDLATANRERDEARGENARIQVALSHRGLRWVPDEWRVEPVTVDGGAG